MNLGNGSMWSNTSGTDITGCTVNGVGTSMVLRGYAVSCAVCENVLPQSGVSLWLTGNTIFPSYNSGLSYLTVDQSLPLYACTSCNTTTIAGNTINTFPDFPLGHIYLNAVATRFEEAKSARNSIEEFSTLTANWDGYGASPISHMACANARYFVDLIEATPFGLPPPDVAPTPVGTISFEWEAPHAEAYVEIGNSRYSGFIKVRDEEKAIYLEGAAELYGSANCELYSDSYR